MKKNGCVYLIFALCVMLCACAQQVQPNLSPSPKKSASPAPEKTQAPQSVFAQLGLETDADGAPLISVYLTKEAEVTQMPLETYLCGVVAAEMQPDWPQEALKAQAIIARTFTLRFLMQEGGSRYAGADVSDDTGEVQAYDAARVTDAVTQAVAQTKGMVLYDGKEPAYTWFHAHSGGQTAGAVEGLNYEHGDLPYIVSVAGMENEDAPKEVRAWSGAFSAGELVDAANSIGYAAKSAEEFSISQTGPSGRATAFDLDGVIVPAAALRTAVGADKMRSTMIDEIDFDGDNIILSGRGYGHGVGMSQWGAYAMAQEGKSAQEILAHFYPNTVIKSIAP